jgi:curli biogenesis system outer membrane secretion channel CsgG
MAVLTIGPLAGQSKRSLAVKAFEYSTVRSDVQMVFGTDVDIGRGISSLVTRRIAAAGCFTVVERERVSALLDEQDFGKSGRVKKGTQARAGEIRGADLTLLGDIVAFGRDDSRKAAGGGAIGGGGAGGGGVSKNTSKAVVTLNFRLANSETSEIVMSGEAKGESTRTSKGGALGFFTGGVLGGGYIDFSSKNFAETIIGEAVIDASNKLVAQMKCDGSSAIPRGKLEGRIATVDGDTIYINLGSVAGVQVGDIFEVAEVVGEVRDPVTHEVLDLQAKAIGKMTISAVRDKVALGAYSGTKPPKPGDKVERK